MPLMKKIDIVKTDNIISFNNHIRSNLIKINPILKTNVRKKVNVTEKEKNLQIRINRIFPKIDINTILKNKKKKKDIINILAFFVPFLTLSLSVLFYV
jgi:hypothetical protein